MGTLPIVDRAGCTNPTGEPGSALSVQEQQEQRRGDTVWPQGPRQGWPQAPHTTALAGLGITGAPKQEERVFTAQGGCSGPFRPISALRAGSSSL